MATFSSRWSVFFQQNQFLLSLHTSDGKFVLSNMHSTKSSLIFFHLTSLSLRPILPAIIFQAYLVEALPFKALRVALSSSVHGCGVVNGERDREGLRDLGCLSVVEVFDFRVRFVLVGRSARGVDTWKLAGKGISSSSGASRGRTGLGNFALGARCGSG